MPLKDRDVKLLLTAGLLVQALAIGAGFTALGWRWPLLGAAVAVALGMAVATRKAWIFAGAVLLISAGHGISDAPAFAWALRIFFGLEALAMLALAVFMLTFRMNRLW
jgi:hypothetical protein